MEATTAQDELAQALPLIILLFLLGPAFMVAASRLFLLDVPKAGQAPLPPPPGPPLGPVAVVDPGSIRFWLFGNQEKRCTCRLGEGTRHVVVYLGSWTAQKTFLADAVRLAAEGWVATERHWETHRGGALDFWMSWRYLVVTYEWCGVPLAPEA